ncbi:MAG: 50S ribosomal protein L4 [Clostridia bacterium]|nr:50S ribosomal protein L4 [Clostridia bacterium]
MLETNIINTEGKVVKTIELNEKLFAADYNEALIHQVVVAQLANKRQGTKSTLTRTEVRGGGIKPWRQKGTGRARQGSIRAPQWYHGGVVFAPKPRDFSKKVNKQMKTAALRSAISQKLRDGDLIIVDKFEIAEPKTKLVAGILKNLAIEKTALLVLNGDAQDIIRAGKNIEALTMTDASLINVYDVVRVGKCVMTEAAVQALTEVYGNE